MEEYNLHSKFDIDKHKKTYINYIEIVILEDGTVEYAVPSHQEKLIKLACQKLNITREELDHMCHIEYYSDFMKWLCKITKSVSVWNGSIIFYFLNSNQIRTLESLRKAGLYKGDSILDYECNTEISRREVANREVDNRADSGTSQLR